MTKTAGYWGCAAVSRARAVEQLRSEAAELPLATLRAGVDIRGADFMTVLQDGKKLKEISHLQ